MLIIRKYENKGLHYAHFESERRKNFRRLDMERKMRRRLERIARAEEEKGNKIWIGFGRLKIGEIWWRWL